MDLAGNPQRSIPTDSVWGVNQSAARGAIRQASSRMSLIALWDCPFLARASA